MPTAVLEPFATPPAPLYLAAVTAVMLLLVATRRLGALFLLTSFPVTVAHELTHLLAGLLSNGRPSQLRLLPRRSADGYVLGSVTCSNVRWYNGLVIGLAPLLLLPAAAALLLWRIRTGAGVALAELPWLYLIACLAYASLPSWQDLRVAAASSWLLIALAGGLLIVAG